MESVDLLRLLDSVSTRRIFILEYCKDEDILQCESGRIDISGGNVLFDRRLLTCDYRISSFSRTSIKCWLNQESHKEGDWILIPISRVVGEDEIFHSLRLLWTSEEFKVITIIDASPVYAGKETFYSVEYSSYSMNYSFFNGTSERCISFTSLTPDEERCLYECARGRTVKQTSIAMRCSIAKVKVLRNSIMKKFNARNIFDALTINQLVAFFKVFGR